MAAKKPVLMLDGRKRGTSCFGPHAHECESCGTIWEHDPHDIHSSKQNNSAHHCPECDTEQYWIYKGKKEASCVYAGRIKG